MSAGPAFRPRPGSLRRHDRALLIGGLTLLVLSCWWQLFGMARGMHTDAFGATVVMWVVMMTGMMVPTAVRSIMVYAQIDAQVVRRGGAAVSGYWFAAGYVAAWIPFSVVATAVQRSLARSELLSPMTLTSTLPVAGILLAAAGLWQLSPVKDRCLRHCRSPIDYLAANYRPGVAGAIRLGVGHGMYCLGCCWLLMSLLFVGGVMNLLWVAAITAFVLSEKLLPARIAVVRLSAGTMIVAGAGCLLWSLLGERGPSDPLPTSSPPVTARRITAEDATAGHAQRTSPRVPSGYPDPFAVVGAAEETRSDPRSRRTAVASGTPPRITTIALGTVMPGVRPVSVTGSLFDVDGFPIVGERVHLSSGLGHGHRSTLTGPDGLFAFPDVRPDDSYRLAVVPARRYRRHSVDPFVVDEWQTPVTLVLDAFPTGSVSGSVVDASGFSVARMGLVVYGAEPGTSSFKVETDTGGRFVAEDVAAGRVTFAADVPAYVPIHTMTLDADELVDVRIVLDPRWHSIRGTVGDDDGMALGGIALCLTAARAPPPTSVEQCPKTDADGTFSLHLPSSPPYGLLVRAPGFRPYSQTVESAHDYLDIRLDTSI